MKNFFYCFSIFLIISFQILAQDTIKVKLSEFSPPYSDIDGNLGLNKILLNKIISPSKHKISIIVSDSINLADLIGLSEKNTIANSDYKFSSTLFKSNYVIVSNIDRKINQIDEIIDNQIGVVENSFAENKLDGKLFFYSKYQNCKNAFFGLLNKNIDYLIVEKSFAIYFLQQELLKDKFFIVNDDLIPTEIGFYVNTRNEKIFNQINTSIAKFKEKEEYENLIDKYYSFPKDYSLLWTIIIGLLIITGIILLIVILRKKKIGEKLLEYYRLNLKGLIIFRVSPTYNSDGDNNDGSNFKDTLNNLQLKFNPLNFTYDYSGNSVKINIKTPKKIFLSDKDFLNNFTDSLNSALKELPQNKYMIDINISGEFSDLKSHNSFLIVNKGNEVGLHIDKSKKTILPNL